MNPALSNRAARYQRGATLMEALVGIVLMATVGLGLGYSSSRSLVSQRYLNTQNSVVSQVREWLLTSTDVSSACAADGPTITVGGTTTKLSLSCQSTAISISTGSGNGNGDEDDQGANASAGLKVTLPAKTVTTTMSVSTPTNENTAALLGGNGKIEVSL